MKKLLFLFFFIPVVVFGQSNLDYPNPFEFIAKDTAKGTKSDGNYILIYPTD